MSLSRRDFLKITAAGAGASVVGLSGRNASAGVLPEFAGMLIDTTMCIGCRSCEFACNEANKLPPLKAPMDDQSVFEKKRETEPDVFTVVNRFPNPKDSANPIFVRRQCMHCNQPACASACLVKAMEKKVEGPVYYNKERCMGCRYCMLACPFNIPKFEYDKPAPYVRKCTFCYLRQKEGKSPACAEACPTGATLFGKRKELLEIARTHIYQSPDKYVHHVYGEGEVGGSGWMYLSSVPFDRIGFRQDLGTEPYPELTKGFLYGVPIVLLLWPAALLGISRAKSETKGEGDEL